MWYERNVMYSVYTLLKVDKSQCDLSVLAVSLVGFQKKYWVGLSSIQFFWGFLDFFLTLQSP